MIAKSYATPQDAEQAFYRAFELADVAEMMAVWAEEEEIVCVHPGGKRFSGVVEVRESWREIFSQGPRLRFRLAGNRVFSGRMVSVHSVYEHVAIAGDPQPVNPVLSTNVYVLSDRGWRMLVHHASPLAPGALPQQVSPPSILH